MRVTETVEIEGEEREVPVEINPEEHGLLTKEQYKERLSEEINSRIDKVKREALKGRFTLDDLAEDEELQQKLRERHPDLFQSTGDGDGGGDGLTEDDLDRFRNKWERDELEPVKDQAESLSEEVKVLRVEKLNRQVVEAASDMGFRDDPGVRRGLKLIVREEMGYSDEDAEWYKRDGDGFEISTSEDADSRYVTVREFLRDMKESGDFDSWLESSTREGAGYGGSKGGGKGTPNKLQDMSEQEKTEFIDEHGLQAYNELVRKSFRVG
jgi:hypothetical protein